MISKNNENIKKKSKDNYKVILTFNKNGPNFKKSWKRYFL